MWESFKQAIFWCLQQLEAFTGDYGFAIILLTVAMRLILMPLTIKQTHAMFELQRIQPKIKELQKKYADNKEKQQEEVLKFYQENKVNPFGGCLPMILQMPIFIALFQVIGGTTEKPGLLMVYITSLAKDQTALAAAKRFWIILPDLTATPQAVFKASGMMPALPYVILVALFGLSVWLPQQLTPSTDPQAKQIGVWMSLMMLFFGWVSPAGVLVYWVTSSVWQIAQQQLMMKFYSRTEGA